jgi:tripartite-type tricarboxylate transporter receptor subunit TctC
MTITRQGRKTVSKLVHVGVVACLAVLCGPVAGFGQAYPSRSVKLVVPFPPGPSDTLARLYGQKLSEELGQTFVIETRAGATGTVGAAVVAHAPPDGYTLMSSPDLPLVKAPILVKVPYDPVKDFEPIAVVGEDSNILAAYAGSGLKTMADLVAAAKAKPGAINYASAGSGSPGQLCSEMVGLEAGIKLSHIPYRGAGPATTAVLSGEVQIFCGPVLALLPHIRAGKLVALAVTGAKPLLQLPGVKPLTAVWPGLQITTWYSFMAPSGTPAPVIATLRQALRKAYDDRAIRDRLSDAGIEPLWLDDGAAIQQRITADLAKWRKVVETAHITVE